LKRLKPGHLLLSPSKVLPPLDLACMHLLWDGSRKIENTDARENKRVWTKRLGVLVLTRLSRQIPRHFIASMITVTKQ
jgi:hypothetical protein